MSELASELRALVNLYGQHFPAHDRAILAFQRAAKELDLLREALEKAGTKEAQIAHSASSKNCICLKSGSHGGRWVYEKNPACPSHGKDETERLRAEMEGMYTAEVYDQAVQNANRFMDALKQIAEDTCESCPDCIGCGNAHDTALKALGRSV